MYAVAIRLQETQHAHNVCVLELGQRTRFFQELLQTPTIVFGVAGIAAAVRPDGVGAVAQRVGVRKVFLERDQRAETGIARQIGDCQSRDPQHALDDIFLKPRIDRERVVGLCDRHGCVVVVRRDRKGPLRQSVNSVSLLES